VPATREPAVPSRARRIAGWTAILLETALACLWAFWGVLENFHEGWYGRTLGENLALGFGQYLLVPILIVLVGVVSVRLGPLGALLHLAGAGGALFFFNTSAGRILIAAPLAGLAALWFFGRPEPRRLALATIVGLPLLTAIGFGIEPAWRVVHRHDDGRRDARVVAGNGVTLEWAPAGPGWGEAASWDGARETCRRLTPDGRALADSIVDAWRLPTLDEAVRSLTRHGANSGGVWDAAARRARYRVPPDKESPLWDTRSPVIYWWTATDADSASAWQVVYNGVVRPVPKRLHPRYFGFRAVRSPAGAGAGRS
jgi:hypothetical protein